MPRPISFARSATADPTIVIGAAAFLGGDGGPLSFNWPLAALELSARGIRVRVRSRLATRLAEFASTLLGTSAPPPFDNPWNVTWDQLRRVMASRRSLVLVDDRGEACRFGVLRRRRLDPVLDAIAVRGIAVERRRSTFSVMYWPTYLDTDE
jgi:hypothetical protein